MTDWGRSLLLVCWMLIGCVSPVDSFSAPLHITTAEWRHEESHGTSPAPVVLKHARAHEEWRRVSLAHAMPRKMLPSHAGTQDIVSDPSAPSSISWYKVSLPAQHQWGQGQRFLYIPRLKMDGQFTIYANEHLLYQNDALTLWNGANTPKWLALDKNISSAPLTEITIRIAHPRLSGGGISSMWIGTHEEINWRYRLRALLQNELPYAFSSAFLAIGFFGFFIWLKFKKDKEYLLFFALSVASFIRTLHYHVGVTRLPIDEAWFTWLTINSLFWMAGIVHVFLNYLHERPSRLLDWLVLVIVVFAGFFTLPWLAEWINAYQISPVIYLLLVTLGLLGSIYGLRQAITSRNSGAKLLSIWGLIGMAFGCYDLLLQSNWVNIESIYLGPLSNILAFWILMRIIFLRYLAAIDDVNALNLNLQVRLDAQAKDLQESHQRLRETELQRQLSQERQRIMQDMHDGIGSNLRTALLAIEQGRLNSPDLANVVKDCIDDLKLTIDSMEPMGSDLLLVLATFRYRIGSRLEAAGISMRWNVTAIPKVKGLTPQSILHILRIFQEAFTNIIKHSEATVIIISTQTNEHQVIVSISDNGNGFSKIDTLADAGRGMNNQKRRAQMIGAQIAWQSGPSGTKLTLTLPIQLAYIA